MSALAWSPDGSRFATCGMNPGVVIWSGAPAVGLQESLPLSAFARWLAWSPDGGTIALGTSGGMPLIWPGR